MIVIKAETEPFLNVKNQSNQNVVGSRSPAPGICVLHFPGHLVNWCGVFARACDFGAYLCDNERRLWMFLSSYTC
jgi:hypothetical protein